MSSLSREEEIAYLSLEQAFDNAQLAPAFSDIGEIIVDWLSDSEGIDIDDLTERYKFEFSAAKKVLEILETQEPNISP